MDFLALNLHNKRLDLSYWHVILFKTALGLQNSSFLSVDVCLRGAFEKYVHLRYIS